MTIGKLIYSTNSRSYSFLLEDGKAAKEQYNANCKNSNVKKNSLPSSNEKLNSLLCALLLGSGRIISSTTSHKYFRFTFHTKHSEWAHSCYQQLQSYVPDFLIKKEQTTDTRSEFGFTERVVIESTPCATAEALYYDWYQNGFKGMPLEFVEQHMTAQTLAWWYQECGHLKVKENGTLEKLILSTEQWTEDELRLLQYVVNIKFNFLFAIDGQRRLILYDQLQIKYFLSIVTPWIHPLFSYKIRNVEVHKPVAKRTTIRLPNQISIPAPTKEINQMIQQYASSIQVTRNNFQRLNYARQENNESTRYQVSLTEKNQHVLCSVQASTGLTLGEIVQECFHQHNSLSPRPLNTLNDLSTTQQNIILGSIIGDGMLTHMSTKSKGIRSTYSEHFSIKQKDYRAWKVMKLEPYLSFTLKGDVISSRVNDLWSELEADFYSAKVKDKSRVKILSRTRLSNLNDLHSIATIYMDDGSLLLTKRINDNNKKIYITPHIALYLQNFTFEELKNLALQIKNLTQAEFTLTKLPDGNGYYLRTFRTADTLLFLQDIHPVTITCPAMSYKTNWTYRFYMETQRWLSEYPDYEVMTSSRDRMRPYTTNEVETLKRMKQQGYTIQQIANQLKRSYWSIVYKTKDLRDQNYM
ncbi:MULTISPECIES: hypothetical protein [unclassified Sporosarcina]|uniref:hypothetical protein n=1 Tax=unclassified Sporosarcina TaxID=2647733 RepID=UPI000C16A030|nr:MULTISPECIES: hypothetical protein [unclassified Sporosarcina]PID05011.1 hypothetical protein CSV66_11965 [Sporosarcina sp. P30]PID08011.1 hypothetical protein CSV65_13105 [Sporosarcina sp. P31]PID11765.1 hypothetical protein CSV64_10200 [Sporosarcina sp. P32b]